MILGRTCRATFGVRLTEDDWSPAKLGGRGDNLKTFVNCGKLPLNAHLNVILLPARRSLGVEADEVERETAAALWNVLALCAVLKKGPKKIGSSRIPRAGTIGSSNMRF